ncbi:hypothetical protein [Cytobacillus oceanisediminis]|uniref:C1q domain-containing protein n=1 Tax=Cytobacillus oceanisediminis 2691 TaxID=1196031 RepID=A0A160MBE0_9BACI|nr:hypothetical protein [Cytobacillus oceanisediminis]AND39628.1 hypothetical protein A361_10925 [Cytobacillus oceanisediminis 2691]
MSTPNLNLPKISGNMSADVVRDMNALADAVDSNAANAADVESQLAEKVPYVGMDKALDMNGNELLNIYRANFLSGTMKLFGNSSTDKLQISIYDAIGNYLDYVMTMSKTGIMTLPRNPIVRTIRSSTLSVSSGVDTRITFDNPTEDRQGEMTNQRFTPKENGIYLLRLTLNWSGSVNGHIYVKPISVNTGSVINLIYAGHTDRVCTGIATLNLPANTPIEFYVHHSGSQAYTLNTCYMDIVKVA